jgi:PIN domain nuclease of toxin-antitoxin system
MKLLLDTHAFVWVTTNTALLSPRATSLLSDPDNEIQVSAVSAYEIENKRSRDAELQRMPFNLNDSVALMGFRWLPVTWEHAQEAARLPSHHRDPWDRILIAQALTEDSRLVSVDRQFEAYNVRVEW